MSQKIEIEIGDGFKLVAEQNADQIYGREIFIGVVDKNGVWVQDLAAVRNAYDYSSNYAPEWKDKEFDILVWHDEDNEDYTDEFSVRLTNQAYDV